MSAAVMQRLDLDVERSEVAVAVLVLYARVGKLDVAVIVRETFWRRRQGRGPTVLLGKMYLWEDGIRLPMILTWLGGSLPDKLPKQPAITMDWSATILAVTGTPQHPGYGRNGGNSCRILGWIPCSTYPRILARSKLGEEAV